LNNNYIAISYLSENMPSVHYKENTLMILAIDQLKHKFLFYNKFIILLYMFRAQKCSKHVEEYNELIIKQEFVH